MTVFGPFPEIYASVIAVKKYYFKFLSRLYFVENTYEMQSHATVMLTLLTKSRKHMLKYISGYRWVVVQYQ